MTDDALCEGVRILLREAAGLLPVRGLGVVHEDGPEHLILNYVDGFSATAYRCLAEELPEPIRPRHASRGLVSIDLHANPDGLFDHHAPGNRRFGGAVRG